MFWLWTTKNMSCKNNQKLLVGQPVFKQILDIIPRNKFDMLVRKHQSDRYYKTFDSWTQFMTMLFGILSRCDSMGELCDGMGLWKESSIIWAWHLPLPKAPQEMDLEAGITNFLRMFTLCCLNISNHFCRSAG